ncbi:hypothetical protein DPEC_G00219180 [Dallia pectoralis]|uniref:Uncharacterized protein n=1 Tax=Dallia pectoralis TaxID=75939 RepID=A0ACC2G3C5_DALPE|nr:hypothetical protein DPEC_G00219180 [Dallia pectoralis]
MLFTSAPVLAHPDPSLPFIVEVDASEVGIGAILSQRSGTPPKVRPCAFNSRKLSAAEQNYDVVAPVMWEVDADIQRALRKDPSPPQCPEGRVYVPLDVRDRLICWAHTSVSSGHPGIGRTVRCLTNKYWWPGLAKDVRLYVSSCSVCAQCKVTLQSWSLWTAF